MPLSPRLICALLLALLTGCGSSRPSAPSAPPAPPLFVDVADHAGVRFSHWNGAVGNFLYPEFSPAGCAFLDYNNDGWPDILLIQSGPLEPSSGPNRLHCALFRNNGDGTFTDVTAGSGLDKDLGYAQGVAIGDYDNDGYDDIFITSLGHNYLFHNEHGSGKFTDVTHKMGLDKPFDAAYATSAAFGDYDNDGKLDLFICYYTAWTRESDKACFYRGHRDYCSADQFEPTTQRLFHNDGDHFTDVTHRAGIDKAVARGMVVTFLDDDNAGHPDIFVGSDFSPNLLFHNNGNGTFTERAAQAGCAIGSDGNRMASMGVALADYDHSGRQSLFVTNFSGIPNILFHSREGGLFEDITQRAGVGSPHLSFLAFGCEFFDYDADGWPDLIVANGHVYTGADRMLKGVTYQERKQLFHNRGDGSFEEITSPDLLGDLATPTVSRGLAVADYDNDGRLDVLVNNQNAPAQLFHNQNRNGNHWITFKTVGTKSNRDGIHAHFSLEAAGMRQTAYVHGGTSYLSHSDRRIYFGLGKATQADTVEIRWPSGTRETLRNVPADAGYIVTEGRGITGKLPTAPPAKNR